MENGNTVRCSQDQIQASTDSMERWDWIPTSLIPHFTEKKMRLIMIKWLANVRYLAEIKDYVTNCKQVLRHLFYCWKLEKKNICCYSPCTISEQVMLCFHTSCLMASRIKINPFDQRKNKSKGT